MSFKPNQQTQNAVNSQQQIGQQSLANSTNATSQGQGLLDLGMKTATPGLNFFQTLLGGNRANTTSLLAPDINRIRQAQQQQIQAVSNLTPRGGGRSGELLNLMTRPQAQIGDLFAGMRGRAAEALPQIGMQQAGLGTNLFGIGNQALNTSTNSFGNVADFGQKQQQLNSQFWGGLGGGLFKLGTTPFGGPQAANTLFGKVGSWF